VRVLLDRLFRGVVPLGLFYELDEADYFRFGFCVDRATQFSRGEVFPQVGFDLYPLPPAVHDLTAGEIPVGAPTVLKGNLVSQEPAPNFQGIVLFDGFSFPDHVREDEHPLGRPFPRDGPWEW